jgi:hypothetical protein
MIFSKGPDGDGVRFAPHWRAEVGAAASGRGGSAELFAAYERMFDDVTRPIPQRSGVLGLGIRFAGQ